MVSSIIACRYFFNTVFLWNFRVKYETIDIVQKSISRLFCVTECSSVDSFAISTRRNESVNIRHDIRSLELAP